MTPNETRPGYHLGNKQAHCVSVRVIRHKHSPHRLLDTVGVAVIMVFHFLQVIKVGILQDFTGSKDFPVSLSPIWVESLLFQIVESTGLINRILNAIKRGFGTFQSLLN